MHHAIPFPWFLPLLRAAADEQHPLAVMAQALRLPPGARVLGSSPTAAYEMWAIGDNVLAFQVRSCCLLVSETCLP